MTGQQLKNSILQMAVQGKLVPQDPNDEPASVLLERIRKEKEQLIKEGKIKKEKNPSYIFRGADNLPYEKVGKNEPVCIADEVPFEIPESWEWTKLKDLTIKEIKRGKSPKYADDGSVYVFAQKCNVKLGGIDVSLAKFLDMRTFDKYPVEEYMADGDIIINSTGNGTLGRIGIFRDSDRINDFVIVPDSHVTIIRTGNQMIKDYLFFALKYHQPYLEKLGEGSTNQTELRPSTVTELLIPVPPIGEQKRIVAKLLEVLPMADVYGIKENSLQDYNKDFPVQLKKSILQEAVQGKLVPQDPTDEPASILLEHIRAEKKKLIDEGKIKKDKHESVIFRRDNSHYEKRGSEEVCIDEDIPFDIPENWTWTRLQNICSLIGDIDHNMPKSVPADEGVLFLSAKDLLDDGTINYTQNVKYISRADFERLSRKALPQKNDIIYSRIGAALGKARLVETSKEFLVSYSCCVVRPLLVYPPYIRYYLESPQILLHSIKARQSIGVPDLGMGEIKKYLVALPPYNEQIRIVNQLEVLLDRCNFKM